MSTPKKIKLNKQESLTITWDDNIENIYPLKFLRDESPDASNKGETILWKHHPPAPKVPEKPGQYEVANVQIVGNYAIQISWKDGYDYGIYSFDLLKKWGEFLDLKNNLKTGSKS